jgi:hypothetical protein
MNKKNILTIVMLTSSLFASDVTVSDALETPAKDELKFDFSFGINQPNNFVPRAESNKLYSDINENWDQISNTFGSILFSNLIPLGIQLKQLTNLLKTDEKFQTLVKNNVEKVIQFAAPLFKEITDEAAKVAGFKEKTDVAKAE